MSSSVVKSYVSGREGGRNGRGREGRREKGKEKECVKEGSKQTRRELISI